MSRPYVQKRRAEAAEATRRRIAQAAMELHGTIGPARTTISAVAERAGVQRLTVYRHFADETALFEACSGHWLSLNPPPDPGLWADGETREERLQRALGTVYAFYERTADMLRNVLRDAPGVPALSGPVAEWRRYLDRARDAAVRASGQGDADRLLLAAAGHALAFDTWNSLMDHGFAHQEAVNLMVALVVAAPSTTRV